MNEINNNLNIEVLKLKKIGKIPLVNQEEKVLTKEESSQKKKAFNESMTFRSIPRYNEHKEKVTIRR